MAIKVLVRVDRVEFDGTTILIPTSLHVAGQQGDVGHNFTVVAANIANAAAVIPFLKGQIVTYVQNQYGVTVIESEVAITGAPQ